MRRAYMDRMSLAFCALSFKYLGAEYPCAIVHWFDRVGDGPRPQYRDVEGLYA